MTRAFTSDDDLRRAIAAELDRRHPERAWFRSNERAELDRGWAFLEEQWAVTEQRIRALPEELRQRRVDDEWSATETLRHLIFVVDSWFSHEVVRASAPFHAIGLGPDFVPGREEMNIDPDARPTFDETVAVYAERQAIVADWLASATESDLARRTAPRDDGWWPPPGERTAADSLHVVLDEVWWHHRFAVRDLAILEGDGPDDSVA